ncbi:ankyrin repeat domain-containing protein [Tamlana sp. I1]|uniref:ankyrin repeat domain-containing protein n=1 Tax=Tamlana sp. I1 TaxID=2762061 RepID=UPI00188F965D|nr:ankyrin repeat domain-containing protein [Tamlana sp. I1]
MKKSIIISTMALCLSVGSIYATPEHLTFKDYKIEAIYKVNSFCVSIAKGDFETVKILIERGADVNAKSAGMTPAMYAAKYNRVEILNLLIENGADLKTKCDKGNTAAKYAEMHGAHDAKAVIDTHLASKK